jgi:hypothetical protein
MLPIYIAQKDEIAYQMEAIMHNDKNFRPQIQIF